MKVKVLLLSLLCLAAGLVHGQKIEVKSGEHEVDKMKRKGLLTRIELEPKVVEKAWTKRLREFGKLEAGKGFYKMQSVTVPAISNDPVSIFSRVEAGAGGTVVFYSIDLGSEYAQPGQPAYEKAKAFLHDFAVAVYREDVNQEIEQADKAVDAAVKVHDRYMESGQRISSGLARNRTDKERLLKALQDNQAELGKLQQDSSRNRLDQETAVTEINRLRAISEEKKAKLSRIE